MAAQQRRFALASAMAAALSSADGGDIALRAPIFKGCDGADGIGGWVLPITLTEPSGRVT
eukprot:COSAG03_NODE_4015_length_1720_cov_19.493678_1_plen_59_part_10